MPPDQNLEEFFHHVSAIPDIVRVNIYARDRTVLWSSTPNLVGKRFMVNEELDEIFMEKSGSHTGVIGKDVSRKQEHYELDRRQKIIEIYIAVLDPKTGLVMGAIELYKNPQSLWQSISTLNRYIWSAVIGIGVLLYCSLMIFMRQLGRKYSQLNPDFQMAKIMALAVSHGMQNSATSKGSSKSGIPEEKPARLAARWTESLERYATGDPAQLSATSLPEVVNDSINGLKQRFEAAKIQLSMDIPANLPKISADPVWLQIALDGVIRHAIKAMPAGGTLSVNARSDDAHNAVYLEMRDSGAGIKSGSQPCETTSNDLELARNLLNCMSCKLTLAPLIDGACNRTLRMNIEPTI